MIVSNSSPVIVLGRKGLLWILKDCFGKVFIPEEVFKEIMERKESVDAKSLQRAVDEGWVKVERVSVDSAINSNNLGKGEKEAISLAKKKDCVLLMDDGDARKYASILNVECHGTLFAIYVSVLRKLFSKGEARKICENLITEGFYISTEVYAGFLNLLESLEL